MKVGFFNSLNMSYTRNNRAHYIQSVDTVWYGDFNDTVWLTIKHDDGKWGNAGRTVEGGYELYGGRKFELLKMFWKYQQGYQWSKLHLQAFKSCLN